MGLQDDVSDEPVSHSAGPARAIEYEGILKLNFPSLNSNAVVVIYIDFQSKIISDFEWSRPGLSFCSVENYGRQLRG